VAHEIIITVSLYGNEDVAHLIAEVAAGHRESVA